MLRYRTNRSAAATALGWASHTSGSCPSNRRNDRQVSGALRVGQRSESNLDLQCVEGGGRFGLLVLSGSREEAVL